MVVVLGARDFVLVGAQHDDVTRVAPRRVLCARLAWLELGLGSGLEAGLGLELGLGLGLGFGSGVGVGFGSEYLARGLPAHEPLNESSSGRSVRLARWRTWKMPIGARG